MLGNYLIGLREGLEAALVVTILVAYLVRTKRRHLLPAVWSGVAIAVLLSVGFGALLTYTSTTLLRTFEAQEAFGGIMSIIAVCLVTWMIFWMRRTARHISGELRGQLDEAASVGVVAVGLVAFLAVGREGLETALFLYSTIQATGTTALPLLGAALGLLTAVLIAYLLYRRAITINLTVFFRVTGVCLIVIAAGVLAYGVHDLQEAGILPGLNNLAFDVSAQVPPGSWYGTVLKGVLNFSPDTTWLQLVAWVGYIVPVMVLFLRGVRTPASARSAAPPAAASSGGASAGDPAATGPAAVPGAPPRATNPAQSAAPAMTPAPASATTEPKPVTP